MWFSDIRYTKRPIDAEETENKLSLKWALCIGMDFSCLRSGGEGHLWVHRKIVKTVYH